MSMSNTLTIDNTFEKKKQIAFEAIKYNNNRKIFQKFLK